MATQFDGFADAGAGSGHGGHGTAVGEGGGREEETLYDNSEAGDGSTLTEGTPSGGVVRVRMTKAADEKWGLRFAFSDAGSALVTKTVPGSPASRFLSISAPHTVVSVNGTPTERMHKAEFAELFKAAVETLALVLRQVVPAGSAGQDAAPQAHVESGPPSGDAHAEHEAAVPPADTTDLNVQSRSSTALPAKIDVAGVVRVSMTKRIDEKWGLRFGFGENGDAVISGIVPDSVASSFLAISTPHTVISVDSTSAEGMSKSAFGQLVREATTTMELVLKQGVRYAAEVPSAPSTPTPEVASSDPRAVEVTLTKEPAERWGINFTFSAEGVVIIKSVHPRSAASRSTELMALGGSNLEVVSVNSVSTDGVDKGAFAVLIRGAANSMTLGLVALQTPSAVGSATVNQGARSTSSDGVETAAKPMAQHSPHSSPEPSPHSSAEPSPQPSPLSAAALGTVTDGNRTVTEKPSTNESESSAKSPSSQLAESTIIGEMPTAEAQSGQDSKFEVTLAKMPSERWGIKCTFRGDGNVVIKAVVNGDAAARCTQLAPGLLIETINGVPTRGVAPRAVATIIQESGDAMRLGLIREVTKVQGAEVNTSDVPTRGVAPRAVATITEESGDATGLGLEREVTKVEETEIPKADTQTLTVQEDAHAVVVTPSSEPLSSSEILEVTLMKDPTETWGMTFGCATDGTPLIMSVASGSAASRHEDLVGADSQFKVLAVEGTATRQGDMEALASMIQEAGDILQLDLMAVPLSDRAAVASTPEILPVVPVAVPPAPVSSQNTDVEPRSGGSFDVTMRKQSAEKWGITFKFPIDAQPAIVDVASTAAASRYSELSDGPFAVLAVGGVLTSTMSKADFANAVRGAGDLLEVSLVKLDAQQVESNQREAAHGLGRQSATSPPIDDGATFVVKQSGLYRKDEFVRAAEGVFPGESSEIVLKKGDAVLVKHRSKDNCVVVKVGDAGPVGSPAWVPESSISKVDSRPPATTAVMPASSAGDESRGSPTTSSERASPTRTGRSKSLHGGWRKDKSTPTRAIKFAPPYVGGLGFAITSKHAAVGGRRGSLRKAKPIHIVTTVVSGRPADVAGLKQWDRIRQFDKKSVDSKSTATLQEMIGTAFQGGVAFTLGVVEPTEADRKLNEGNAVGGDDGAASIISGTEPAYAVSNSTNQDPNAERAAIRIQAAVRGHAARKRVLVVLVRENTTVSWGFRMQFNRDAHPLIEYVTQGSPTAVEGSLQPGMSLLEIDGHDLRGASGPKIVAIIGDSARIRIYARLPVGAPPVRRPVREHQSIAAPQNSEDATSVETVDQEAVEAAAATTIQAGFRGSMVRKQREKEVQAAIKLQAAARGHAARKRELVVLTRDTTSINWGFRMNYSSDYPILEYIIPRSPAAAAGTLSAGMALLDIDGESVKGATSQTVTDMMKSRTTMRVHARLPFGAPPRTLARSVVHATPLTPAMYDAILVKSSSEKWGVSFKFDKADWPVVSTISQTMAGVRCKHMKKGVQVSAVDGVSTHGTDIHRFADLLRGKNTLCFTIVGDREAAMNAPAFAHTASTNEVGTRPGTASPTTPRKYGGTNPSASSLSEQRSPSSTRNTFKQRESETANRAASSISTPDRSADRGVSPTAATPQPSGKSRADYYHDVELTLEEVTRLLAENGGGEGSYMIHKFRPDATKAPINVLCVLHGTAPNTHVTTHAMKASRDGGMLVDNTSFGGATTMEEVVEALSDEAVCHFGGWRVPLTAPVPRKGSTGSFAAWSNPVAIAAREEVLVTDRFKRERARLQEGEDRRRRESDVAEAHAREVREAAEHSRRQEQHAKENAARAEVESHKAHRRTSKQLLLAKFNIQDEPDHVEYGFDTPKKHTSSVSRSQPRARPQLPPVKDDKVEDANSTTFEGFSPASPPLKENFEGFAPTDTQNLAANAPIHPPTKPKKKGKPYTQKKESVVTSAGLKPPSSATQSKKKDEKKSGWFNTFRRKQAVETVIETRTVMRTIATPSSEEFTTCKKGDIVEVIRELPDNTVVIKTDAGRALLPAEAFLPRRDSTDMMDNLNFDMFTN